MEEVELQYIPVIVPSDIVPIFWWSHGSIRDSESIVISDIVPIVYSANMLVVPPVFTVCMNDVRLVFKIPQNQFISLSFMIAPI